VSFPHRHAPRQFVEFDCAGMISLLFRSKARLGWDKTVRIPHWSESTTLILAFRACRYTGHFAAGTACLSQSAKFSRNVTWVSCWAKVA